jgi:hypothetical protein
VRGGMWGERQQKGRYVGGRMSEFVSGFLF